MDSTWQGTVLLADLRRDASRLYASAGPTKALQAIQNCVAVLERAAWDGGATFVRATGDEVMALFPAPTAAADAASAMQMAADALPPVGNSKLGVRIAFQSGPVVVRNGDVLGDTVSMTSRLIEEAQKEQIITSRDTAAVLGHSYRRRMRTVRPSQFIFGFPGTRNVKRWPTRGSKSLGNIHSASVALFVIARQTCSRGCGMRISR